MSQFLRKTFSATADLTKKTISATGDAAKKTLTMTGLAEGENIAIRKQNRKEEEEVVAPTRKIPARKVVNSSVNIDDVMAGLDPAYQTKFIFESIEGLDDKGIQIQILEKEAALEHINNKLTQEVMANYNAFVEAMIQIRSLSLDLKQSSAIARNGRQNIAKAQEQLSHNGLVILSKARKRQMYNKIKVDMEQMKLVVTLLDRQQAAVRSGDFPKAIECLVGSRKLMHELKDFQAISLLSKNLEGSTSDIEGKLEGTLRELCGKFDGVAYSRVANAYRLLGNEYQVLQQIRQSFATTSESQIHSVLYAHCLLSEENSKRPDLLKKLKYSDLCKKLNVKHAVPCFLTILEVTVDLLRNFVAIVKWHESAKPVDEAQAKFYNDILSGLSGFRTRLFEEMQRRVARLMATTNFLASLQIEHFLKMLDHLQTFIAIGEEFTGAEAFKMRAQVKKQSVMYFETFHKNHKENLRQVLANENWISVVNAVGDFTVAALPGWKQLLKPPRQTSVAKGQDGEFFASKRANPFINHEIDDSSKILLLDDDDVPDELKKDYVEDDEEGKEKAKLKSAQSRGPMLSTAGVNLLRYIGKYFQMIGVLSGISFEVFRAVVQLWEYYLFSIFSLFGGDANHCQATLKHLLTRLDTDFSGLKMERIPSFSLSSLLVAIEGFDYCSQAWLQARAALERTLPAANREFIKEFFERDIDTVAELRRIMYSQYADSLTNFEPLSAAVGNTKWDLKDIPLQHSPYVGQAAVQFKTFLDVLKKASGKENNVPGEVRDLLINRCLARLMDSIVEGYSRAKRVTNEGIVLRQLDLKTLQQELEKLTTVRPIPHVNLVDAYIKAFYLTVDMAIPWIKQYQHAFSKKQMVSMISQGFAVPLDKTRKQQLLLFIDELDKQAPKPAPK